MITPLLLLLVAPAWAQGNRAIPNFNQAKKLAREIHRDHAETLYCGCKYRDKTIDLQSCGYLPRKNARRAARLEWEHVVPAEAFGQSFKEWREGSVQCVKAAKRGRPAKSFKGRKCAETNPEFARMEADLYNLWPEIGELNGLRSNYSMAELSGTDIDFGDCDVELQDRKFEPEPQAKGIVARVYMYMEKAYPGRGIVSEKNAKLFEAWDRQHPVTQWECERADRIREAQGNENSVLRDRCSKAQFASKR